MPDEHVTFDIRTALQKARSAKGMTQRQLAQLIREKPSVINDYEAGRALPDNGLLSRIEKVLGSKLPRMRRSSKDGGM